MSADGVQIETPPIAEADFVCQARTPSGICGARERHPTNPRNMCVRGHFIVGSQQRLTHGARAFERHGDAVVPADVRMTADDMLAGIIADKGGANNLTTLKRELAQQARNFRVMLDLILHDLVRNGVTTIAAGVGWNRRTATTGPTPRSCSASASARRTAASCLKPRSAR
jgi:hypothetical protein